MRILYTLSQYPKLSETFVLREIERLHDLGHELMVCSFRRVARGEADEIRAAGFWIAPTEVAPRSPAVLRIGLETLLTGGPESTAAGERPSAPLVERLLERLAFAGLGRWVGRVASAFRPDYIHAHFASTAATAAWAASRVSGVPFGFTAHAQDIFVKANPWLAGKTAAAALPVTISEFNRTFLMERLGPELGGRFEVVRCGVDPDVFTPGAAPPTYDICAVGRLVEKKGFDVLLRALACLPEPRPSCRIVGDGPLRAELERGIRDLGLAGSVRLLGTLPNPEVRTEMARARLFVLPCRVAANGDRDGVPVVLIEALTLAKAVISTPVAGIPELIQDGRTGLLTGIDRPDQLAAAIARLLEDPALAQRLGAAGRAHVESAYDVGRNVADLAERIATRIGVARAGWLQKEEGHEDSRKECDQDSVARPPQTAAASTEETWFRR